MLKSFTILVAAFILLAATDSALVAQSNNPAQTREKEARRVRLQDREAVVYPNIQIHPNPTTEQFEVSIATHPLNPNIVLTAAATQNLPTPPFSRIGYYYTTDGGAT
ncbi:MAG: hypothetical protein HY707_09660 [Ignavibacteriae bacterium]|nr:hypothetical protein [Ignavibacteriota bacterium]